MWGFAKINHAPVSTNMVSFPIVQPYFSNELIAFRSQRTVKELFVICDSLNQGFRLPFIQFQVSSFKFLSYKLK